MNRVEKTIYLMSACCLVAVSVVGTVSANEFDQPSEAEATAQAKVIAERVAEQKARDTKALLKESTKPKSEEAKCSETWSKCVDISFSDQDLMKACDLQKTMCLSKIEKPAAATAAVLNK